MSGPIVRTGTNPKFWKNWDNVFGDKSGKGGAGGQESDVNAFAKPRKKSTKAAAAKAAPKKSAPKSDKKKGSGKKKK